jgi:hypothetical protein
MTDEPKHQSASPAIKVAEKAVEGAVLLGILGIVFGAALAGAKIEKDRKKKR